MSIQYLLTSAVSTQRYTSKETADTLGKSNLCKKTMLPNSAI